MKGERCAQLSVLGSQFLTGVVIVDILLQIHFRGSGWGVMNRGVSLGMFPRLGQELAVIVYFIFIILYLNHAKSRKFSFGLTLLALGGLGNLVSRLFWGGVWDYIYLPILPFWFNLSDVMIAGGILAYGWGEMHYT